MIKNTTAAVRQNPLVFIDAASGSGGADQAIAEQEKAGQAQLVNSDRLPADIRGREVLEGFGVVFGEPDAADPMFCPATLPEGWRREASDHDMWSYLVDGQGRRRASIFYKAAFYDREAFIRPETVVGYLWSHVHNGTALLTDDVWATPAALADACVLAMEHAQEEIDTWARIGNAKYVEKYTAQCEKYAAVLAQYRV
ncbi:hypothetical protein E6R60_26475 [Streptomyces sp. A0642]|uniref:hypothetical protein n=1 Tax=Streptomyces sp. A0642 TaxID=2563100 RepID=UPI0010A25CBD|nr:hypothetical protein [Streptomyces sp. A0642]THA72479.1 hypothetical protein E6R60_26475 [Streptomyces sp. A0642]